MKEKKPLWKRWWVWVLVLAAVGYVIGGDKKDDKSSAAPASSTAASVESVDKTSVASVEPAKELTLEEQIEQDAKNAFGDSLEKVEFFPDTNTVRVSFDANNGWSGESSLKSAKLEITNFLKSMPAESGYDYDFEGWSDVVDVKGNESHDHVLTCTVTNANWKSINFENFLFGNLDAVADEWWASPVFTN